jgi:hypothetical protein
MLTYADDGIVQIEEFGMHVSVEGVVLTGVCVCVCECVCVCVCVSLIVLYMCPHSTIYVFS